jgi:hypothetical protein
MESKIDPTSTAYWSSLAKQTRRYGHTYVHAAARAQVMGWQGIILGGVQYTYCGYGRSLQSGGHKYKVHAKDASTGQPVPSKKLA